MFCCYSFQNTVLDSDFKIVFVTVHRTRKLFEPWVSGNKIMYVFMHSFIQSTTYLKFTDTYLEVTM